MSQPIAQPADFRAVFSFLQRTLPRVECSWCGDMIRGGCEPVSHGICAPCAKEHFQIEVQPDNQEGAR